MSGVEFLFDTNVVIGHLKGRLEAKALIDGHSAIQGTVAVSQFTRFELLSFPRIDAQHEAEVFRFLRQVEVIPFDDIIERKAIELRRLTRLKHADAIIGATARVRGLTLLTLDAALNRALAST